MYKTPTCSSSFFPHYCLPSVRRVISKYLQFSRSAVFSVYVHLFSFSSSSLFIWPTPGILWISAQVSSSFSKAYPELPRMHCYPLLLSMVNLSIPSCSSPNFMFYVVALFISHVFCFQIYFSSFNAVIPTSSSSVFLVCIFSWFHFLKYYCVVIFKWASYHNIVKKSVKLGPLE